MNVNIETYIVLFPMNAPNIHKLRERFNPTEITNYVKKSQHRNETRSNIDEISKHCIIR